MQPKKWKVDTSTVSLSLKRLTPTNRIISSTLKPIIVSVFAAMNDVLPPTYKLSVVDESAGYAVITLSL